MSEKKYHAKINKDLVHQGFETYRLSTNPIRIHGFPLKEPLSTLCLPSQSSYSYKHIESLFRMNHLYGSHPRMFFVDQAFILQLLSFEEHELGDIHPLMQLTLPNPGVTLSAPPSIAVLNPFHLLVFDGYSRLFSIELTSRHTVHASRTCVIALPVNMHTPILVHASTFPNFGVQFLLRCQISSSEDTNDSCIMFRTYVFNIMPYSSDNAGDTRLDPIGFIDCESAPYDYILDSPHNLILVSAHLPDLSPVHESKSSSHKDLTDLSCKKHLGASLAYNWTQSDDEVIIYVQLPTEIPKSDIKCLILSQRIEIKLLWTETDRASFLEGNLFDTVAASDSLWTVENKLLTLYLTKKHLGFRWMHVFDADDGVFESMGPDSLVEITNALERFHDTDTSDTHMIGHDYLNIMDKEEEIAMRERSLYLVNLSLRNSDSSNSKYHSQYTLDHYTYFRDMEWLGCSLPCTNISSHQVLAKSDIDGLLFSVHCPSHPEGSCASHSSTFPGLGFVQASKTEKKWCLIAGVNAEYALVIEGFRLMYVYKFIVGDNKGHQWIVDLSQSSLIRDQGSPVLGAQTFVSSSSRLVVVLLCQDARFVITGFD